MAVESGLLCIMLLSDKITHSVTSEDWSLSWRNWNTWNNNNKRSQWNYIPCCKTTAIHADYFNSAFSHAEKQTFGKRYKWKTLMIKWTRNQIYLLSWADDFNKYLFILHFIWWQKRRQPILLKFYCNRTSPITVIARTKTRFSNCKPSNKR